MAGTSLQGLFYTVKGPASAPVLVLCHGIGMNHQTFLPQMGVLTAHYRVVVWDLPGHGQSTNADLGCRFSWRAADAAASILDALDVSQAVFVGQSLGSLVVQHVVNRHPARVTASVHLGGMPLHPGYSNLWGSVLRPVFSLGRLIPAKVFYRSFAAHRAIRQETKAFMERAIAENGKSLVLQLTLQTLRDMTEGLPHPLPTPCLIMVGDQEVSFVRKSAIKWHERLAGSELRIISDAGHIANQDNPEAFNQALMEFLTATI